jgi:putative RecB family exonuclease
VETISASQAGTYLLCPLKYRFQYIDRLPKPFRSSALAFGTSIHAAIEWFHRERIAGRSPDPEAVAAVFAGDWQAQNLEPLAFKERETEESLADLGRRMLELYVRQLRDEPAPLAVEEAFEVDLHDPVTGELLDLRLRGRMDLLEVGETVVDIKTAARTIDTSGVERHLQLSVYALAYLHLRRSIPHLRLDVLLKTKAAHRALPHRPDRRGPGVDRAPPPAGRWVHRVRALLPQPRLAVRRVRVLRPLPGLAGLAALSAQFLPPSGLLDLSGSPSSFS